MRTSQKVSTVFLLDRSSRLFFLFRNIARLSTSLILCYGMQNLLTHKGIQRKLYTRLLGKCPSDEATQYNLKISYNFSRNTADLSCAP